MNKAQLIAGIAKETKLPKSHSELALNAMLKLIAKNAKKEAVQLVGFGTFKTVKRAARKGVNPRTGDKIKIPARKVFAFRASKSPKY